MYYRIIPILTVMVVVCCLVWALASTVGGSRYGYGGFYPIFFGGSSWSHGGYYHGSYGGGSVAPSGGSSGRSPSHSFSGGGTSGEHGGK